jgi:hypothetical protein
VVRHNAAGYEQHDACPMCGFYSLNTSDYENHMNVSHPNPGFKWVLEKMPASPMPTKYWILSQEKSK